MVTTRITKLQTQYHFHVLPKTDWDWPLLAPLDKNRYGILFATQTLPCDKCLN
jgi:diadenosine tetraphosphate (Ap4A) HIT family hydrolase